MNNKAPNNDAYLKSVLHKNTGFTTPENYFSEVEEKISSFIFEEQLPEKTGFCVPEKYFKNLDTLILEKINKSTKKESKTITLKNRFLKFIPVAAAASVALFLGINYFNSSSEFLNFDTIGQSDIEYWLDVNEIEFTTDEYVEILTSDIMIEEDLVFTDLKKEAIEDYIINTENTYILNENY